MDDWNQILPVVRWWFWWHSPGGLVEWCGHSRPEPARRSWTPGNQGRFASNYPRTGRIQCLWHTRKSLCAFCDSRSYFFSRLGNQFLTKWMFWSTTQWPFSAAISRARSATGSCPCPSETLCSLPFSAVKPIFLPKASTSLRGSTPLERMKNTGVVGPDSSKDRANSIVRLST